MARDFFYSAHVIGYTGQQLGVSAQSDRPAHIEVRITIPTNEGVQVTKVELHPVDVLEFAEQLSIAARKCIAEEYKINGA